MPATTSMLTDLAYNRPPLSLNLRGTMHVWHRPLVMAIINATPDSFHAASRCAGPDEVTAAANLALEQGADILDIGACSTRPGATLPSADQEMRRLDMAISAIRNRVSSTVPLSVDTFRADVARRCVEQLGADIINDISGGTLDDRMTSVVARTHAPYILTHMRGTPADMQQLTDYGPAGVTAGVGAWLAERVSRLEQAGVADIIVDPGFGFAKTVEQNWQLLNRLPELAALLGRPLLVGISRKSMLTRPLGIAAADALEATTATNMAALIGGASILRVHDTAAARQAVELYSLLS